MNETVDAVGLNHFPSQLSCRKLVSSPFKNPGFKKASFSSSSSTPSPSSSPEPPLKTRSNSSNPSSQKNTKKKIFSKKNNNPSLNPNSRSLDPSSQPLKKSQKKKKNKPYPPSQPPLNSDFFNLLSSEIATINTNLQPTRDSIHIKSQFLRKLSTILSAEFPSSKIDICVFGSSVNGLGTVSSDVDICLITSDLSLQNILYLNKALKKYSLKTYCIPHARVPIVKVYDPELCVFSDINVNNTIALVNTKMIQTFLAIDERALPFVMLIKHWAKQRQINDAAFGGTLSPYSWVNLALSFLQMRSPPILPVLHPYISPYIDPSIDCRSRKPDLDFNSNPQDFVGFGSSNHESTGQLLYEFFRFYGTQFDYLNSVVSLRHGHCLKKSDKGWDIGRPKKILCIEEPFSTWLNLAHGANVSSVKGIFSEILRAHQILKGGGSIFKVCEKYNFSNLGFDKQAHFFACSSPQSYHRSSNPDTVFAPRSLSQNPVYPNDSITISPNNNNNHSNSKNIISLASHQSRSSESVGTVVDTADELPVLQSFPIQSHVQTKSQNQNQNQNHKHLSISALASSICRCPTFRPANYSNLPIKTHLPSCILGSIFNSNYCHPSKPPNFSYRTTVNKTLAGPDFQHRKGHFRHHSSPSRLQTDFIVKSGRKSLNSLGMAYAFIAPQSSDTDSTKSGETFENKVLEY
ncbi:Poly(A) RNA polymerase cid11 [Smittium mucronatum]|uniref:polynucleotide adenylyltransferase n=1 Tax=Smittium mucronatum TaxID=133383 RepID=A0A1R0H1H9_9FUNG|nr:Poly(A) RNA polymerase cid11 [Smittium mucronatum]